MINEDELRIANTSYTNKDFISIYPELLDIAKKISPRWDPSLSNESDPGVVLIKLLAFIGDKLDYNIDKNTLEAFLPSATQEKSVRNLCERNGYFPKYYKSAETNISFRYDGDKITQSNPLVLPAFKTVVTDVDGEISYSLLQDCTIYKNKTYYSAPAIQGVFKDLIVGNKDRILISDLDDNNRVYLPEAMIAENGVFVFNVSDSVSADDSWERVDNLNLVEPSNDSFVFKFGFDSERALPYIEFPVNISDLIGSGLYVKYLITKGAQGNVSANTLTVYTNPLELKGGFNFSSTNGESSDTITVNNFASTVTGHDPETIDEAYNSFKKTVGTFDTLVTCRDYMNAMYNAENSRTGSPFVSNVQVADRRTDINYGINIVSQGDSGKITINTSDINSITPYDLCVYPLKPIETSYTVQNYINSFTPLSDADAYQLEDSINGLKTISHNYKTLKDTDIYAVKNYYKLNTIVTTNYKVNAFEQDEIKENIISALVKAFNAREVDYGYEIPFDSILNVIKESDVRIKNISLDEPDIYTRLLYENGDDESDISETEEGSGIRKKYIETLARNILAGRLELFDYDNDFDYDFGQTSTDIQDGPKYEHLAKASTEVEIKEEKYAGESKQYELRENEVLQCIAPNLSTKVTYPAYVYFRYENVNTSAMIKKDTEHLLVGSDVLYIQYTDSSNNVHKIEYHPDRIIRDGATEMHSPNIIKANFDIKQVNGTYVQDGRSSYDILNNPNKKFFSNGSNDEIYIREIVERVINDQQLFCYWKVNDENNALFGVGDEPKTRLLEDTEYFVYCDSSKAEMVILGSGTVLELKTDATSIDASEWTCPKKLLSDITKDGLTLIEDFNWVSKNFSNNNLVVRDTQIVTLTEGSKFYTLSALSDGESTSINNKFKEIEAGNNLYYKFSGEKEETSFTPLPSISVGSYKWKVRSRLNLNAGPDFSQKILDNHTIKLSGYSGGTLYNVEIKNTSGKDRRLMFSVPVQMTGGDSIDLSTTVIKTSGVSIDYIVSAYLFDYETMSYELKEDGSTRQVERVNSIITLPLSNIKVDTDKKVTTLYFSHKSNSTQLVMFYLNDSSSADTTTISASENIGLKKYNQSGDPASPITLSKGINVIEITGSSSTGAYLDIKYNSASSANTQLVIGKLSYLDNFNSIFRLDEGSDSSISSPGAETSYLLNRIKEIDTNNLFYYNYPADNASLIDIDDTTKAQYFWSKNNIYNKMTLGEIDFSKSKIQIAKTSKL